MKHSDKPNLLLLTSSFPSSPGDETCGYIRDLARSLAVEFNVTVLAPPDCRAVGWPPDAFTLTRSRSILPFIRDPFQAGDDLNDLIRKSPLAKLAALVSVFCFFAYAVVLAPRADVICSNWMVPSAIVGALISRAFRRRHVVIEHSGALHLLARMRGGGRIARFIVAGSDRVVTVSEDLKRKLVVLCPQAANKIDVIPMGINITSSRETMTAESDRSAPAGSTILFIGRLTEIKGLEVLLKAMEGLVGVQVIIAGDGETRDNSETLARRLSVNAHFIGRVGALERQNLFKECDAVVIPSIVLANGRSEGTPVVCLEAMAAGRAVIASRVGGLSDLIRDGENGFLFEQGDHRMLKEKLMLALSDEGLRRNISENARRTAADYDWTRIGLQLAGVLRKPLTGFEELIYRH